MSTAPQALPGGRRGGRRRPAPRLLLPTDRADLRVTWHPDEDRFVLSLWHRDRCVGTAPLGAGDAAQVASFLVTRLGDRGTWIPRVVDPGAGMPRTPPRRRIERLLRWARRSVARTGATHR
jgi:hypothetical protein